MTADNSPSRSLVISDANGLPVTLGPEIESAAGYARAEKAGATRRAYRSDFALFRSWCEAKGIPALPASPEAVAAFLAAEASRGRRWPRSAGGSPPVARLTSSPPCNLVVLHDG
jgi:hypothetical protein